MGHLELNLSKSVYRLSAAPRSSVTRLEPVEGGLNMSQDVDDEGKVRQESFRGLFDSKHYRRGSTVTGNSPSAFDLCTR